ncbi:serine/threonine protein phosphatase, partial [Streptomyces sp. SID5926]|nr:serine/threonine protein phosphatase [Streptomyces sp. SID5926]
MTSSVGASWMRAPCPVLVADAVGVVVEANVRAAALFPEPLRGARLTDVAPSWLAE